MTAQPLPELDPKGADCLLFDWDGTLVDSQYANYRALAEALAPHGPGLEQDWFEDRTGLSARDAVVAFAAEHGLTLADEVIGSIVQARDERFLETADQVRLHPAVAAVVSSCRGRLPMAVASGASRKVVEATLGHLGIADAFDAVVTRDDVEHGKPAPDIFLLAARLLGAAPAGCLVYEDSDEGIAAAIAAGMAVVDVRPFRWLA